MQSLYLFNYSKISAGDYAEYVFKIITQSLSKSKGGCRFNHGDDLSGNAKNLAAHARSHNGRLLQAGMLADITPLTDPNGSFNGGIYFIGILTDESANIETLHQSFNQPDVQGYVGMIEFRDQGFDSQSWNHLTHQLSLPLKMEIYNGERCR